MKNYSSHKNQMMKHKVVWWINIFYPIPRMQCLPFQSKLGKGTTCRVQTPAIVIYDTQQLIVKTQLYFLIKLIKVSVIFDCDSNQAISGPLPQTEYQYYPTISPPTLSKHIMLFLRIELMTLTSTPTIMRRLSCTLDQIISIIPNIKITIWQKRIE